VSDSLFPSEALLRSACNGRSVLITIIEKVGWRRQAGLMNAESVPFPLNGFHQQIELAIFLRQLQLNDLILFADGENGVAGMS
jgi:hypothetical protein